MIGAIIAAFSTLSLLLSVILTRQFLRDVSSDICPNSHLISILKPLKGIDNQLTENLAAFLDLQGCPYEVLLGIADVNDAAVALVKEFLVTHPQSPMRLIITGESISNYNPKVLILAHLEKHAIGDILLVSDANTRPHPNCLKPILATFANPQIGVASSPFFVRQPQTIGAKFRALRIGTLIASSICGGYKLTKIPLIVGKWMAVRREALIDLGGFITLREFLCEDGVIFPKLQQLNWQGAIIHDLIDIYLDEWTISDAWAQQLRWSRLVRFITPIAPIIELLWNGIFLLFLSIICANIQAKISALTLAIAAIFNWICYSILYIQLNGSLIDILLLPLQDFQIFLIIIYTYFDNSIIWRGKHYRISKNGKILPT